MAVSENHRKMT